MLDRTRPEGYHNPQDHLAVPLRDALPIIEIRLPQRGSRLVQSDNPRRWVEAVKRLPATGYPKTTQQDRRRHFSARLPARSQVITSADATPF